MGEGGCLSQRECECEREREIKREKVLQYTVKIRLFFVHLSDIFSPSSRPLVPCYCFLYRFSDFLFDLTSKITRNRCDPDLAVGWVKIFPVNSRPEAV